MRKHFAVIAALGLALSTPLVACTNQGSTQSGEATQSTTKDAASDFDANKFYVGQWRGAVEVTGTTVYGTAGGTEQMLDVNFKDDGTVEVTPLEKHADLLKDTGTWEGTAESVTLHLSKGDIVLSVKDKATLTGNAKDFGIADFDEISFDFYG